MGLMTLRWNSDPRFVPIFAKFLDSSLRKILQGKCTGKLIREQWRIVGATWYVVVSIRSILRRPSVRPHLSIISIVRIMMMPSASRYRRWSPIPTVLALCQFAEVCEADLRKFDRRCWPWARFSKKSYDETDEFMILSYDKVMITNLSEYTSHVTALKHLPARFQSIWTALLSSFPSCLLLYSLISRAPSSYEVWGSAVSSLSRVWGGAPTPSRILCILAFKYDIWWQYSCSDFPDPSWPDFA